MAFNPYLQKLETFADFYDLAHGQEKKFKGDLFEHFAKYFFQTHHLHKDRVQKIYLYDEIPLKITQELKLPSKDKGIDILMMYDNEWIPVQCKFRQDTSKTIAWKELSTFFMRFAFCRWYLIPTLTFVIAACLLYNRLPSQASPTFARRGTAFTIPRQHRPRSLQSKRNV